MNRATRSMNQGIAMGNELDEMSGPVNEFGRDVNVIERQLVVHAGFGTQVFEVAIWIVGVLAAVGVGVVAQVPPFGVVLIGLVGLVPGLIFQYMKVNAKSYLQKLQQKMQADASQIDNYLEQRVVILENLAGLLSKSIDLDKDVMKSVAAYRSGMAPSGDEGRNLRQSGVDEAFSKINVAFESYPELRAQSNIAEAMRQNSNLQREITAARTLYNDTVTTWNQVIFSWPTMQIVASKSGYSTRIPFSASQETKDRARSRFFGE